VKPSRFATAIEMQSKVPVIFGSALSAYARRGLTPLLIGNKVTIAGLQGFVGFFIGNIGLGCYLLRSARSAHFIDFVTV
jgi:hypothetical protein